MKNAFHNTVGIAGKSLKQAEEKAMTQNEMVLAIFRNNPSMLLTPHQVLDIIKTQTGTPPLITSIRRSMTNLTKNGFLLKSVFEIDERYGKPNYAWKLHLKENPAPISLPVLKNEKKVQHDKKTSVKSTHNGLTQLSLY